jgi:hypothetical protein
VDEQGCVVGIKREGDFDFWMLLFYGTFIPSTATFFRRKLIDDGHLLDASQKVCMDLEYYLRLADAGVRFEHLAKPLASFRWHETNVSSLHRARAREEFRALQRHYLRRHGLSLLANEPTLSLLHASYRARRFARRLGSRPWQPTQEAAIRSLGWWRNAPASTPQVRR